MKSVLVIGPTNLDLNVDLSDFSKSDKLQASYSAGGKGLNVARNFKLLEVPTTLATSYSNDEIGIYLSQQIRKFGIDDLASNQIEGNSSVFVGVHNRGGDTIFDKVEREIESFQRKPEVNWEEISFVLVISAVTDEILDYLVSVKKEHAKIKFGLEIAGAKTLEVIEKYLFVFDFFICNQREYEALTRIIGKDYASTAKELHSRGISLVIVTLGGGGLVTYSNIDGKYQEDRCPSIKMENKVISTVGAGDSITGVFCSLYYVYQKDIEASIKAALEVAALTIRSKSPYISDLPDSIKEIIKRG